MQSVGIKEGDFIVAIGDTDTKWYRHNEVVALIREAENDLRVKLVTPTDRNYLRPRESSSNSPTSYTSSISSGMSLSSGHMDRISPTGSIASTKSKDSHKKMTWNPFRRALSKDRSMSRPTYSTIPPRSFNVYPSAIIT